MDSPLATLEQGSCTVDIYETAMPAQFNLIYRRQDGSVLAEEPLTGVSSYRQREQEIRSRLTELCKGRPVEDGALSDAGEY